ncbi:MAG: hypothetical protein SFZ24_11090 [Planctomycetota bacterium]|nr:hypothetical protein [Planctomycetota bacterium]
MKKLPAAALTVGGTLGLTSLALGQGLNTFVNYEPALVPDLLSPSGTDYLTDLSWRDGFRNSRNASFPPPPRPPAATENRFYVLGLAEDVYTSPLRLALGASAFIRSGSNPVPFPQPSTNATIKAIFAARGDHVLVGRDLTGGQNHGKLTLTGIDPTFLPTYNGVIAPSDSYGLLVDGFASIFLSPPTQEGGPPTETAPRDTKLTLDSLEVISQSPVVVRGFAVRSELVVTGAEPTGQRNLLTSDLTIVGSNGRAEVSDQAWVQAPITAVRFGGELSIDGGQFGAGTLELEDGQVTVGGTGGAMTVGTLNLTTLVPSSFRILAGGAVQANEIMFSVTSLGQLHTLSVETGGSLTMPTVPPDGVLSYPIRMDDGGLFEVAGGEATIPHFIVRKRAFANAQTPVVSVNSGGLLSSASIFRLIGANLNLTSGGRLDAPGEFYVANTGSSEADQSASVHVGSGAQVTAGVARIQSVSRGQVSMTLDAATSFTAERLEVESFGNSLGSISQFELNLLAQSRMELGEPNTYDNGVLNVRTPGDGFGWLKINVDGGRLVMNGSASADGVVPRTGAGVPPLPPAEIAVSNSGRIEANFLQLNNFELKVKSGGTLTTMDIFDGSVFWVGGLFVVGGARFQVDAGGIAEINNLSFAPVIAAPAEGVIRGQAYFGEARIGSTSFDAPQLNSRLLIADFGRVSASSVSAAAGPSDGQTSNVIVEGFARLFVGFDLQNSVDQGGVPTVSLGRNGSLSVGPSAAVSIGGQPSVAVAPGRVTLSGPVTDPTDGIFYPGGILQGTGRVQGVTIGQPNFAVINNGGQIFAGSSPGILTIDGDLIQNIGSIVIEIGGPTPGTGYDQLIVLGDVFLNGGTINLVLVDGYVPPPTLDLQIFSGFDSLTVGSSVSFTAGPGLNFEAFDPATGQVTVAPAAPPCPGDADGSGSVNFTDITSALANFGTSYAPSTGPGDADLNGVVNFTDITTVLANFGTTCL